jgi:hypothetical protein
MPELTPRERVLLALSHQETDRVPEDSYGRYRLGKNVSATSSA